MDRVESFALVGKLDEFIAGKSKLSQYTFNLKPDPHVSLIQQKHKKINTGFPSVTVRTRKSIALRAINTSSLRVDKLNISLSNNCAVRLDEIAKAAYRLAILPQLINFFGHAVAKRDP